MLYSCKYEKYRLIVAGALASRRNVFNINDPGVFINIYLFVYSKSRYLNHHFRIIDYNFSHFGDLLIKTKIFLYVFCMHMLNSYLKRVTNTHSYNKTLHILFCRKYSKTQIHWFCTKKHMPKTCLR